MTSSLIDADSMLVIDVGTVATRALLFDVVDGRYRFLASGTAATTAGAPFRDVGEGVRLAIDRLQQITGRTLVDSNERLIIPSLGNGSGVDTFAATLSAGPPLKMVAVGLLDSVSVESARRLATTTYCGVVQSISLGDRRKQHDRIDAIIRLRPDLVVVAGGTEGGASQSVLKLLESVGLACYLMPPDQRPEVLYAGNSDLQDEVTGAIGGLVNLHFAENLRPALEVEQLEPAQIELNNIYRSIRARQIGGVNELINWAGGNLMPGAAAFGRIIRYFSKVYKSNKGVLGVDVGASSTTLAAAFSGEMVSGVYPQFGLGQSLFRLLEHIPLNEIMAWLPLELSEATVQDYLANQSLYPASIPVTAEELAIGQAVTRSILRHAVKALAPSFPSKAHIPGENLLPWFEPIVATGSVFTGAPTAAQSLMMLIDGLQPTGVSTLVLDQNHIASALGAAAAVNPVLAVQVLSSNSFMHLGTIISPVGNARPGTPILRVKMAYGRNHETTLEIKQGALEVLPLPMGAPASLYLQSLHRTDVGMGGAGRSGGLRVVGGALGIIIDARGRPLALPEDAGRRRELLKKWLWTLGG